MQDLFYNVHVNYKLQEDYNKYGADAFYFSVIEIVREAKDLLGREQYWIDTIEIDTNYNILDYAKCNHRERVESNYGKVLEYGADKNKFKNIVICDHKKLNRIGDKINSLSKTWYGKNWGQHKKLSNHLSNFNKHLYKEFGNQNTYWTTFLSYRKKIECQGVVKSFVSLADVPERKRNKLAFLVNIYPRPHHKHIADIDSDKYALNFLLQWIENVGDVSKRIVIYLPSRRMRELLRGWQKQNINLPLT